VQRSHEQQRPAGDLALANTMTGAEPQATTWIAIAAQHEATVARRRMLGPPADHQSIESSFATIKLRTRVTKGAGSKQAALAMAYKLLDTAQQRWRRFNGHELVADVLAGATYRDGILVTDDINNDKTLDENVAA
jgi:hypothetical protein